MNFLLNYLFYVGIILPTVVTLALFVFFVICWRKQSARKAVLTKPYDPHGTMRRMGIPNKPPPPPVFLRPAITPTMASLGGEDNAAYDMSRSPSAEASAAQHHHHQQMLLNQQGAPHSHLQLQLQHALCQASPHHFQHPSPPTELDIMGRLAYHSRLDSGLSEPACHSPGAGGGGGGGGQRERDRDRPQSQASHSSHSTDSEDSGFRSSRSGQVTHGTSHSEPPVLKRSQSAGRNKGRGYYHKAATSSPESDTEPSIALTPTALWQHHYPQTSPHHYPHPSPHHHPDTGVKEVGGGGEGSSHVGWKYLQDLGSPGHKARDKTACSPSHVQTLTCHQSMTLAQVHTPHGQDSREVFGFSVV